MENTTVTIGSDEYQQLIDDQRLLNALQAAGVDNWEGYEDAIEFLNDDLEEEDEDEDDEDYF